MAKNGEVVALLEVDLKDPDYQIGHGLPPPSPIHRKATAPLHVIAAKSACQVFLRISSSIGGLTGGLDGAPTGIRTPVTAVKWRSKRVAYISSVGPFLSPAARR